MFDTLSTLLIAVSLLLSLSIWWSVTSRIRRGEPVLPTAPRRNVPWQGPHVAVAFFLYVLVLPWLVLVMVRWRFEIPWDENIPKDNVEILVWSLISVTVLNLVAAALVVSYLRIDLSVRVGDLGWTRGYWLSDVIVGLAAFLAIAPIVYSMHYVLSLLHEYITEEKIQHPVIEMVERNPTSGVLMWAAISSVLVAPLVEEFLFRVVLQGWLERLVRAQPAEAARVTSDSDATANRAATDDATGAASPAENDDSSANPYASPLTPVEPKTEAAPEADREAKSDVAMIPKRTMWPPIIVSSIVFAFCHIDHGAAPIPIFVFALVLGYLYQRTHRMLPSLITHISLNATSMIALWFGAETG